MPSLFLYYDYISPSDLVGTHSNSVNFFKFHFSVCLIMQKIRDDYHILINISCRITNSFEY